MLAELKDIHGELLSLVNELAKLTGEANPDRERLSNLRWRLSSASGKRRRMLEERIYPYLLARLTGPQNDDVAKLRDSNGETLAASRQHVSGWSTDRVMAEWATYRDASSRMRETMRRRIAAEQIILYPLLDRLQNAA